MQEPFLTSDDEFIQSPEVEQEAPQTKKPKSLWLALLLVITFLIAASYGTFVYVSGTPTNFPVDTEILIEPGTSTKEAAQIIKDAGAVHSKLALLIQLRLKHQDESVKASSYIFEKPLTLAQVAQALITGDNTSNLVRITHREGESNRELSRTADATLPDFDATVFLNLADDVEGKLFPETYFVPVTYTAEDLFVLLTDTFTEKLVPLESEITAHPLTLDEIIILASILEREANTQESKRMVSGILQTRLDIGMALQVDASMEYVLDKPLKELTAEDLKTESPYNTYLNPGLPPTPIGNPGLEAIEAVLNPLPSNYLFYITGDDGNFYYAEDFEAHKRNIARHLR